MRLNFRYLASLLLLSFTLVGCGPGSTEVQQVAVPTKDILKASLQNPADSGQLGSEVITIEESIQKMKAENAANADALAKDFEELKGSELTGESKSKSQRNARQALVAWLSSSFE